MTQYLSSDSFSSLISKEINDTIQNNAESINLQEDINVMLEQVMAGFPEYLAGQENPADVQGALASYLQSPDVQAQVSAFAGQEIAKLAASADTDQIMQDVLADYTAYAAENGLPDPSKLTDTLSSYLATEEAQSFLMKELAQSLDTSKLEQELAMTMNQYSAAAIGALTEQLFAAVAANMASSMDFSKIDFSKMFSFDASAFANAFSMNMSEEDFSELMAAMMQTGPASYDSNLRTLGYCDLAEPIQISIYANSFESKESIKAILDGYNERMKANDEEDKVITYTDIVAALMSSVTDIIDAISYVLIAFVSISLVVSSIMIGVITYISVLERRKEIGILRAIGASKRNISEVFNAETFIIGALAGILGIVITLLLLIPGNALIQALTNGVNMRAALPPGAGVILILLSIVLTLIGGLIPSRKAAKSDPVTALRVE